MAQSHGARSIILLRNYVFVPLYFCSTSCQLIKFYLNKFLDFGFGLELENKCNFYHLCTMYNLQIKLDKYNCFRGATFQSSTAQCPAFVLGKKSILEIIHQQQKSFHHLTMCSVYCVWVLIAYCLCSVSSF